jgi:IS5 family transposase
MLRKKSEFDKEFSILIQLIGEMDDLIFKFESHTDIICRGKINVDVEFGHKVWLDEVDGGIVSNYRILKGNPHDTQQLIPSLAQHLENFGSSPKVVTTDRNKVLYLIFSAVSHRELV